MNPETLQALNTLASKLGTTVEYLWAALMRQAPIDATINVLMYVTSAVLLYLFHRFISRVESKHNDKDWLSAYDRELLSMLKFFFWFMSIIVFSFVAASLPTTLAGFFNPEYWAIKQILK